MVAIGGPDFSCVALPAPSCPTGPVRHRISILLAGLATLSLSAHPEIEDALRRLQTQISAAPAEARLYLERGELYAQVGDTISADANFHVAATLNPNLPRLDRAQAALELAQHRPAAALRILNRALLLDPHDAEARILRARAWSASGDRASASRDYATALAQLAQPSPEIYLDYAACAGDAIEAIRRLDAGCERLGDVPALLDRALQIEESAGRIDQAVARLDRIIAGVERPESWLKRRGDLLQRAGRDSEAHASYAAARETIRRLPAWLQDSPATMRLTAEIAGSPNPSSSP